MLACISIFSTDHLISVFGILEANYNVGKGNQSCGLHSNPPYSFLKWRKSTPPLMQKKIYHTTWLDHINLAFQHAFNDVVLFFFNKNWMTKLLLPYNKIMTPVGLDYDIFWFELWYSCIIKLRDIFVIKSF